MIKAACRTRHSIGKTVLIHSLNGLQPVFILSRRRTRGGYMYRLQELAWLL